MPDNVAASMTASIILDKSDLLAQILKGLSEGQKELQNNKLEMYFDFSNSKNQAEFEKVIQKYRKQLSSQEFVVQIKDQGIDETVKSLDKLVEVVKSLASGKTFGTGSGNGKGIGNSIVDEKQLKTVINLFEKMESHLSSMRKVISDVGDGNEFSPLLNMINKVDSSISELAKKTSNLSLNMNLDFGSDDKMTAEVQARTAKLLHTYENLFNRLKMSGTLDSNMQGYFDNFDINQYDNMNAKIAAYKNFITEMREMSKQQFGKDYLYSDIEKSYYSAVSGAQRSLNNIVKSEGTANNSVENLFGKTDLSEVINQLTIIVNKLDEISVSATKFTDIFKNGLDVNTSIQEVTDLTNRVKELEAELAKIKNVSPAVGVPASESNISSENITSASVEQAGKSVDSFNDKLINSEKLLKDLSDLLHNLSTRNLDSLNDKYDNIFNLSNRAELDNKFKELQQIQRVIKQLTRKDSSRADDFIQAGSIGEEGISTVKSYIPLLEKLGYTLGEIQQTNSGTQAKIIPIDDKAITNGKEMAKILLDINSLVSNQTKDAFNSDIDTSSSVKSLENLEEEIKKIFTDANELQDILDSLHNGKYFHLSWTTDGIDETGADERVRQLSNLLEEYGFTINNFKSDSDAFDTSGVINALKAESNALDDNTQKVKENTEAKEQNANANRNTGNISGYDKRLSSYENKLAGYNATVKRFGDEGWTSPEFSSKVNEIKDAINQYKAALNQLKTNPDLVDEKSLARLDELEAKIKGNITAISNMSAAEKGFDLTKAQKILNNINSLLDKNSKMSKEAKDKIQAYYDEIASGNPSKNLNEIYGEVLKIVNLEDKAGRSGRSLKDIFQTSRLHQMVAQVAGMFSFYDLINVGRQATSTIIELDDALVDLKKTTAMSSTELEGFYYDSNEVAKQMGVTTQAIIDQASSWSRLGYNTAETSTEMAKLSSQFASISPGMDTDTAQEGLVSIMKAWRIDPDDVKSEIMDPINTLGNQFAESNQDIIEGMERSAAALAATGTTYQDAFALFTGAQEVLQNSEVAGRALRSISMRVHGYSEDSEDGLMQTDEELKNVTGDLIDLTKTAEHTQGVSIFKDGSTTEFKSLVDYFGEIHDIWDEMSQKQQNDFLQKAFGKTQADSCLNVQKCA